MHYIYFRRCSSAAFSSPAPEIVAVPSVNSLLGYEDSRAKFWPAY